ncbi:thioredoxin-dependent thiol peroxidase [Lutibaculum baratangense]|uniref:thioredoxin-dependent peroxiredoxin n=1 Tax=Lutibaculum baratangense AMV1 TaxID=631454 RepID=V4RIB8_9HYPH|nr:thioredoxin-dependent thiol peroxidase [Lutibaculum baratangense]ESR25084.1 Thiol peroxidase, Bcp-type [Lutibaculum baratangense AMV1]
MSADIHEGAEAPDFTLAGTGGDEVTLTSLRGRKVVVYFYPKDDTPGCTKEAIGFTELAPQFREAGTEVIGISPDPVEKHEMFLTKHGLAVRLLSDPETSVLQRYGVWGEKSMYGRTYMGVERTTMLIGADGRIARIWRKVKVPGHAEEVLEAARAL